MRLDDDYSIAIIGELIVEFPCNITVGMNVVLIAIDVVVEFTNITACWR